MPRQKGTPKTGGRKKGTPNRLTRDVREYVECIFRRIDPEKMALSLLKCRSLQVRAGMFQKLLEHYYGKPRQAMEVSGPNGAALKFENMSQADIDARIAELLKKYQESRG
jgi:hypothetical protein